MTLYKRRLINYTACLFAALLAYSAASAQGSQNDPSTKVIRINGTISEQLLAKIRLQLLGFQNADPFPAGLIVLLDSNGGDGEAAMEIGRIFRQHKAHIFVTNQCDSACVFLLMGGVVRGAMPGTLGVHAGRLTEMKPNGQVVREVDASQNLSNSFQLAGYNRNIRLYLQEMGIAHNILDVILAHKTRNVYKLTVEEMREYGIIGFDNKYLNQRVRALDSWGHGSPINMIEFYNRTMSVPQRCRSKEHSDLSFINCYKSTLENGR